MLRVLSVFGTRPEAIKMAPVIQAMAARPEVFESKVCVTAQHRSMLDQTLQLFGIVPDYDLDIMAQDQSPTQVAAAAASQTLRGYLRRNGSKRFIDVIIRA